MIFLNSKKNNNSKNKSQDQREKRIKTKQNIDKKKKSPDQKARKHRQATHQQKHDLPERNRQRYAKRKRRAFAPEDEPLFFLF